MSKEVGPFTGIRPHDGEFMRFWCNVCNKQVDSVGVETPVMKFNTWSSDCIHYASTGEKIVTVSCHGESISISNWHGVL